MWDNGRAIEKKFIRRKQVGNLSIFEAEKYPIVFLLFTLGTLLRVHCSVWKQ